ncbi:MAG: flagellar hook-associated protein FlgK [Leptospiraceae bacterium]|nr:flagellar hook-associated protein FlgK [Leptospiraceae bacterium]MDW7976166.1 flagellar hook-associated protein FlgK [Leptospiraceae bacterium]
MGSTFGGLEITKRGLFVHQTAIQTTGHNISNASNPNYARQRVEFDTMDPLYEPTLTRSNHPGQLGQGAKIALIERIRNFFYDDQIINTSKEKQFWDTKFQYLYQLEKIINEPSDQSLRNLVEQFWSSWQDLSQYPAELSHRAVVVERAQTLVNRIQDMYRKIQNLRERAEQEIQETVQLINNYAKEIQELNVKIAKLQALGDQPNDLLDKRDAVIEKLSSLVNIRIGRGDKDEMMVFIGEQAIVQGSIFRAIQAIPNPQNEGMSSIIWEHNQKPVIISGGKLNSLLELRDQDILSRLYELDEFTVNLVDIVNEIHRDGFGLDGSTNLSFFEIRPITFDGNATFIPRDHVGDFDFNFDGVPEMTAIFRVAGTQKVDPRRQVGISGILTFYQWNENAKSYEPVQITYRENETLEDIIKKINQAKVGVVAYLNHESQLVLKAARNADDTKYNFFIKHIEDSGDLLVGYTGILRASGSVGAFDFRRTGDIAKFQGTLENITVSPLFKPSLHVKVNDVILRDLSKIAAATGKDVGGTGDYNTPVGLANGENALLIARALKQGKSYVGYDETFLEFHTSLVSKLGAESQKAEELYKHHSDHLLVLNNLRQSLMGVNLDEEMANLIQFQHAYNASARALRAMDELLDVIINRLKA